jgi:hypothetical protein
MIKPRFVRRHGENSREISVRTADVMANIRIENLPFKSIDCYFYADTFDGTHCISRCITRGKTPNSPLKRRRSI